MDNIDIAKRQNWHHIVQYPGASTRSVVELTIGHLIASTRHITTADRTLRNGNGQRNNCEDLR